MCRASIVVGSVQMPAAAPLEAIGKIGTAIGSVTIMRADGVLVRPSVGALVYQGHTIETEADGAVGITFIDGTVFDLSAASRLVLNEFSCERTGAPNSALFSLVQGAFSFVAGKIARAGGLKIDTPFATIRGTAQDRGIGILTLAALTFAAIEESQAASRHDAFLDDGTITYKDLPHGTFEIVTRDGRVIMADDPGETIVIDPTGSVARLPNSASRMAELQQAQQSALGHLVAGAARRGVGRIEHASNSIFRCNSIRSILLHLPLTGRRWKLSPPRILLRSVQGLFEVPELKPPLATIVTPVLAPDAGLFQAIESHQHHRQHACRHRPLRHAHVHRLEGQHGKREPGLDDLVRRRHAAERVWGRCWRVRFRSRRRAPISGFGSIATTFSAPDRTFDFLAANEALTIVYNVTVTGSGGVSLTQPVTIAVTGTNDAPVLAADASGPHTVTERLNTTGTFAFTDVDLTDHHTVSTSVASAIWSGGATLPSGVAAALADALSTTVSDGAGSGSIAFAFSAGDSAFDFLTASQTLTITYEVTVTDNNGVSSTQPVTVTITGTNEAPVITSGAAAARVSEEGLTNGVPDTLPAGLDTTNSTSASGTITATDVDGDALTISLGAPSASLTSGGVAIAWTLQDAGHTLIGKAGTATIITATITDAGTYNVALSGPIDHSTANQEDNTTFTVPVIVSDGHTTTPTTLSVTIEDDSPKAEPVEVSVVPTDSKTNVMLILDLSGSMDTSSGLTGLTRLDVAKAAINEVLDQYDNRGDVMVRIVTFSDTGAAVGSAWQSVADAKAAIAGLSAGGNTNYDAALLTAMGAFTDGTKLTGPGTQNVSYFLSDGDPTAGHGVNQTEQQNWESFLETNNIVSFALGILRRRSANGEPRSDRLRSGIGPAACRHANQSHRPGSARERSRFYHSARHRRCPDRCWRCNLQLVRRRWWLRAVDYRRWRYLYLQPGGERWSGWHHDQRRRQLHL